MDKQKAYQEWLASVGNPREISPLAAFEAGAALAAPQQQQKVYATLAGKPMVCVLVDEHSEPAPQQIVLPERATNKNTAGSAVWQNGWNSCLYEVERLNGAKP